MPMYSKSLGATSQQAYCLLIMIQGALLDWHPAHHRILCFAAWSASDLMVLHYLIVRQKGYKPCALTKAPVCLDVLLISYLQL